MQAHAAGRFAAVTAAIPNFGLGARPTWVRLVVYNPASSALTRRLTVRAAWLDRLDMYVVADGVPAASHRLGDTLPFADRAVASRFLAIDLAFAPGTTVVYMRADSIDPMVFPIYLDTIEQAEADEVAEGYSYGLLYGGLFSLLAYNLMLFVGLRSRRYLMYSLYLGAFVLMNLAYTGHAYRYLWPASPQWQQVAIPLLMVSVVLAGFLFATTFLNTRRAFPRHNRLVIVLCAVAAGLELAAVATGQQLLAVIVAFALVFPYSVGMILLGVIAWRAGDKSARFYLGATVAHVSTASVVALAVSGFIPYSELAYRAVEVGMMLDAVLLALALADQFRINQEQKIKAEQLAKVDPLTQLNNRRGFYRLAQPRWNNGVRRGHVMSAIMLDVDRFKALNDRFGHAQGDRVLVEVARLLLAGVRDSDIAARWGGEEFVVFLDQTGLDEAVGIAERFRESIEATQLQMNDEQVGVTASFGVAGADGDAHTLEALIARADEQLYQAKQQGRNRVCAALA